MRVLYRSSERHLAGLARFFVHPLHGCAQPNSFVTRKPAAQHLSAEVDDRLHSPYHFLPLLRETPADLRQKHSDLYIPRDKTPSNPVQRTDHTSRTHANSGLGSYRTRSVFVATKSGLDGLNVRENCTALLKAFVFELAVDESDFRSTRHCNLKKQRDVGSFYGSKISKSKSSGITSCRGFLQLLKRGLHALPEKLPKIDSEAMSGETKEKASFNSVCQDDTKETLPKNTRETSEDKGSKASSLKIEELETRSYQDDEPGIIFAASSKKWKGCGLDPYESCDFTILAKKIKNIRKKNHKKFWNAERQFQLFKLKKLTLVTPHSQIPAVETDCFVEKLKVSKTTSLPEHDLMLAKVIYPKMHFDSLEFADSFTTNDCNSVKGSESLGQKLGKQVKYMNCSEDEYTVQDLEQNKRPVTKKDMELLDDSLCKQRFLKLDGKHEDLSTDGQLFTCWQESFKYKELKVQEGSHALKVVVNDKGSSSKQDVSSCFINTGKMISCNDLKASTSGVEKSEEKSNVNIHDTTGASNDHYSIRKFSLNSVYIILDLNGLLIKRWNTNPSLPGVVKLNKKWIQLRPGCIEFLRNVFTQFRVGIWSTMTNKNVLGVCKLLEQHADQSLPFFMQWSKDFCYQQKGIHRPDKSRVLADFKPLSRVWHFFEPNLGFHNTVLIDDSPYKACMNNQYNCIFPDAYEGRTDDNFLTAVLWPYLEKMRMSQNLQAYIANNPLGQPAVVAGHKLYHHVQSVVEKFNQISIPLAQLS